MRSFGWSLWVAGAAMAVFAGGLSSQVSFTLTGTPNVFAAPTLTDFNAGVITNPTGIVFTVNVTGGSTTNRTSIVSIRASSATLGGGKALSDLEWRRSDQATTWHAMTTTNTTIESRTVRKNSTNDPWSNTVFLRMQLDWTTDAPATYTTGLVFTLTITTP